MDIDVERCLWKAISAGILAPLCTILENTAFIKQNSLLGLCSYCGPWPQEAWI